MAQQLTPAEEELVSALSWLVRVTEGGAYDDDDYTSAHNNAVKLIEKYVPEEISAELDDLLEDD
jgi:hypothetical protein